MVVSRFALVWNVNAGSELPAAKTSCDAH